MGFPSSTVICMLVQLLSSPKTAFCEGNSGTRKIGSVGIAVRQGSLALDQDTGELIYSGPNVMVGYADSRLELAKGDGLQGILQTGDLARRDEDGYYYITGRS